jgi:hypothetical protein
MMQQWWARYGATKASGISKLIISEASNFPELARFYQEEVVVPGTELVRRVLQRGIDRGEFRAGRSAPHRARHHGPLDLPGHVEALARALLRRAAPPLTPNTFIAQHADLMVRGLLKEPNRMKRWWKWIAVAAGASCSWPCSPARVLSVRKAQQQALAQASGARVADGRRVG